MRFEVITLSLFGILLQLAAVDITHLGGWRAHLAALTAAAAAAAPAEEKK
jgi:hypothetical protein